MALAVTPRALTTLADGPDVFGRRHRNLDYAASTPALRVVSDAVEAFLPWYASVHRGGGLRSRVSTAAYEGARAAVADFVGAAPDHEIVFVRNTTEAVNLLAAALPAGARVLSSPAEHHANMLPWRRRHVDLLPFTHSPDELLARCEERLRTRRYDLVAVTGASNVTGEVWPLGPLATLAHAHGAELFADTAQLAPHRALDLRRLGVDHIALSGHKLYAPFGSGALVARRARLAGAAPLLAGGGAVRRVTLDRVEWADAPARFEAGTPNVVGAVALGAACDALASYGMELLAAEEDELARALLRGLRDVPGLRLLRLWPGAPIDRLGVASFVIDGVAAADVARTLARRHDIAVRGGAFCAHPLLARLVGGPAPAAVRASVGIGVTHADVAVLVEGLQRIARGDIEPDRDLPDELPPLPFRLAR